MNHCILLRWIVHLEVFQTCHAQVPNDCNIRRMEPHEDDGAVEKGSTQPSHKVDDHTMI